MYSIFILQLLSRVNSRSVTGTRDHSRRLGRWSFNEPCIAGPILYENPKQGKTSYDKALQEFTRTDGRVYEDKDFKLETTTHTDTICDIIDENHTICDYFMVDEVGVFSLFTGIAELNFTRNASNNDTHHIPIGKGRYVFQGGSDLHGGIIGKVNTVYEEDLITHDFCVQGSTYDHLVPPLPSDLNSSKAEVVEAAVTASESYDDAARLQVPLCILLAITVFWLSQVQL